MVRKYVRETIVFDEEDIREAELVFNILHKFKSKFEKAMNVKYPIGNDEIVYLLNDINGQNIDAIKDFFDTYGYDVEMPFFF